MSKLLPFDVHASAQLLEPRDVMAESERNQAAWRDATINLTNGQRDILRCVLVGSMMTLVEPEKFEKALGRAMEYLHPAEVKP